MKIVHVGFRHRPDDIRIFQKECLSLARQGHQVIYVTSNRIAEYTGTVHENVQIIVVPLHQVNRWKRFLTYCRDAKKILCSLNADIYHFHEALLLPLLLCMRRKGKKVIYDLHEDTPRDMEPQLYRKYGRCLGKLLVKFIELSENYCIKRADYIITATPHIEERCRKITDKVECVANYPIIRNSETVGRPFCKRERIVCYTGGISEINGIFNIVKAMGQIDGTLYLAGNLSEELENQLEKYDGWDKVCKLGYVAGGEVQNVLQKSMVGLVLYLPSGNTVDALPNKLFEYMEAGLPVIASNFPLWKEIVEKNKCGICVNPDSPAEIAGAVNEILAKPEWAEELGKNGKKVVWEKYNWEIEKKKLLEIYDGLNIGKILRTS